MGWQVLGCKSAELASQLLQDIRRGASIKPDQLTVHSDNGGPMKGQTMVTTPQELWVAPSRSRPAVINDNPYSTEPVQDPEVPAAVARQTIRRPAG